MTSVRLNKNNDMNSLRKKARFGSLKSVCNVLLFVGIFAMFVDLFEYASLGIVEGLMGRKVVMTLDQFERIMMNDENDKRDNQEAIANAKEKAALNKQILKQQENINKYETYIEALSTRIDKQAENINRSEKYVKDIETLMDYEREKNEKEIDDYKNQNKWLKEELNTQRDKQQETINWSEKYVKDIHTLMDYERKKNEKEINDYKLQNEGLKEHIYELRQLIQDRAEEIPEQRYNERTKDLTS